jgi:hypothetical protein
MGPDKWIAVGNLEVGVGEYPWSGYTGVSKLDFLDMPLERSWTSDLSSPLIFLSLPLISGRFARLGLDFWPDDVRYSTLIWGAYPLHLLGRGPEGPLPTVRLQMVREGVQNFEARLTIIEAMAKLSEEQKKPYQGLLNTILYGKGRLGGGSGCLIQTELNGNAPGLQFAQIYRAAEELSGIKTEAKWEEPPK